MINREWQKVKVVTFSDELDKYGQKRQGESTEREIEMVVKIYTQSNVEDPKYVDVDMIGITKDKDITDANQIEIGDDRYNVKFIIPSGRYCQVFMSKA